MSCDRHAQGAAAAAAGTSWQAWGPPPKGAFVPACACLQDGLSSGPGGVRRQEATSHCPSGGCWTPTPLARTQLAAPASKPASQHASKPGPLTAKYWRVAAGMPSTLSEMSSMRHWLTASPPLDLHARAHRCAQEAGSALKELCSKHICSGSPGRQRSAWPCTRRNPRPELSSRDQRGAGAGGHQAQARVVGRRGVLQLDLQQRWWGAAQHSGRDSRRRVGPQSQRAP